MDELPLEKDVCKLFERKELTINNCTKTLNSLSRSLKNNEILRKIDENCKNYEEEKKRTE